MVKKLPIRERMKVVIETLRKGKKTWTELKKLGVPEKTLDRILKDYLEYWGLAKKEGYYWVWYEYSREISPHDYQLAIEHSKKLIPALKNMLNVAVIERHELHSAAKEHLKSYPEIYGKLGKFEKAFNDRVRELLEKHGDKIRTPDKFFILDPVTMKKKGFLGKLGISETKFRRRDVPFMIAWKGELNESEIRDVKELRDLLENTKAFNERFEIYREFAGDISLLILKIEMGEPLEGKCFLCPRITIKERKGGEKL
jgi:hypothetical protein